MNVPVNPGEAYLKEIRSQFDLDILGNLIRGYTENHVRGSWNYDYMKIGVTANKKWKLLKVHHIVWYLHHDKWPAQQIDHIDKNTENNNINNLREVTYSQQQLNKKYNNGLPPGVTWNKREKKYEAQIKQNRKKYFLGYFNVIEEAKLAYEQAYKSIYGKELSI